MGLRARLALFFVAITVVPLVVALVALQIQIDRELRRRAARDLQAVARTSTSLLVVTRERAGDLADDLVDRDVGPILAGDDPQQASGWLRRQLGATPLGRVDFVLLIGSESNLLATTVGEAEFSPGFSHPGAEQIAQAVRSRSVPPGVLLEARQVEGSTAEAPERILGWVVTGVWLDRQLLGELAIGDGIALVARGEVLAARGAPATAVPTQDLPAPGTVEPASLGSEPILLSTTGLNDPDLVASDVVLLSWALRAQPLVGLILALLVPSVLVAAAIGWLIASSVVAPVRRAADVARAVAAGDLGRKLEPTGGPELADLAGALNVMSAELATRLEELENSRDELRGSLARLGETLSSSLDLNRTLSVVTETAMDTLGADRAILQLFTPERDALYTKVGRGVGDDPPRLRLGEGVTGWVAQTSNAVLLPADAADVPDPAPGEPTGGQQLAVPLMGRGNVIGVLSLLRDIDHAPFTQDDLDTIRSFAAQASVAIENVMLHQEAQRLSVTDMLTGLWNFRYFQLQADRELESASRFQRPLALLIVDIDHFKPVNDRYGHQVGDDVLAEVARRIRDSTRVPDVVARYGGEEFVILLPGTELTGAVASAERIRAAVGASSIMVVDDDHELGVTCSVGVASFPDQGTTVAGLLRSADAAMYTAKTRGRDQVVAAGSRGLVRLEGDRGSEQM